MQSPKLKMASIHITMNLQQNNQPKTIVLIYYCSLSCQDKSSKMLQKGCVTARTLVPSSDLGSKCLGRALKASLRMVVMGWQVSVRSVSGVVTVKFVVPPSYLAPNILVIERQMQRLTTRRGNPKLKQLIYFFQASNQVIFNNSYELWLAVACIIMRTFITEFVVQQIDFETILFHLYLLQK